MCTDMEDYKKLLEEREYWKEQCEEAEKRKSQTLLAKLDADDKLKGEQKRLNTLLERQSETDNAQLEKEELNTCELQKLKKENYELKNNITELEQKLKERKSAVERMQKELKVENKLPLKNINFTQEEQSEETPSKDKLTDICYTCHIVISDPYDLQPGQALVTFESEQVAKSVIGKGKHVLTLNNTSVEVRACGLKMKRTVEFEINMDISTKKLSVSGLPADVPEELLKDKMELTFYKSGVGGGEIEEVEYNKKNNTACITYLQNGVAQRVLKRRRHQLTIGKSFHDLTVQSVVEQQLNKLQIFSGITPRTVLLAEIQDKEETEDDIQDIIEIHFQKPSNGGGEVEALAFSLEKIKALHFEEDLIEA
ncbi:N-myc-interactor [Mixophyes fleayi]|uniref:N-myc-interactor n=1 Tax=Mixophyes fleayi TaxID=3061075 RepID=UPI003F4DBF64